MDARVNRLVIVIVLILLCSVAGWSDEVAHPSLNIPHLCTFGNQSDRDWGDDDFSQTVFFVVPPNVKDDVYIRVFDPDVGGRIDEIQGSWNTRTRFSVYGGEGAYTTPGAKGLDPEGDYRSGTLLADEIYGKDSEVDGQWIILAKVSPTQGEFVGGNYLIKVVVDGIEGDDGNLYNLDCSIYSDGTTSPTVIETFAYEWSFRLPNETGTVIYTFPFLVPTEVTSIVYHLWDFDSDNRMYLNSPTRPGLPAYVSGNDVWAVTKYNLGVGGKVIEDKSGKRWLDTTYNILEDDYNAPWLFEIHKGTFTNNDIALYITDQNGDLIPMYSVVRPRSGVAVKMQGKYFEPNTITLKENMVLGRDVEITADINIEKNTVLPEGTKLAKGTVVPQEIKVKGGAVVPAGTTLDFDITTQDGTFIPAGTTLEHDILLKSSTAIPAGTTLDFDITTQDGTFIPAGTTLEYDITLGDGTVIPAGTKLDFDVFLEEEIIVRRETTLKAGSILPEGTLLSTGSEVYEGLAPADYALPSCNTVFFDASNSTDPDGNPLHFSWDLGDGTKAVGERVIHSYREPGQYIVSMIARDNSGAINDAASKGMVILINAPPIAKAGSNKFVCANETIRFDGSESHDRDGLITDYVWSFGDGSSAKGKIAEHTYQESGLYIAQLKVTDNSISDCPSDISAIVVAVNDPPVAIAGDPITGCDNTIEFDGSQSFDPDGMIVEYLWYFGDGSVEKGSPTPTHTYDQPGTYKVKLVVSDNSGANCDTGSDELVVAINSPPVANAGPDRKVCMGDAVYLDGAGSFDPNGDIFYYHWDFGDGESSEGAVSVIHTYKKGGTYTATLTVRDRSNTSCNESSDTVVITVETPPVAVAGSDQRVGVDQVVQFDGSASSDPNGYPIEYRWVFGDLSDPQEGVSPTHSYLRSGVYTVRMLATTQAGTSCNHDFDELTIAVNHSPVAQAGNPIVIHAGGEVTFDGSTSFDPDGSIGKYEWDFGDGSAVVTDQQAIAIHAYSQPGQYSATLKVWDDSGLPGGVDEDTRSVIVNVPPVADAGQSYVSCSPRIVFDGTASSDSDGEIVDYLWDFGDGSPAQHGVYPLYVYKDPGVYEVKLTVTDNSGTATNTAVTTKTITINAPPVVDIGDEIINSCANVPTSFDASASTDANGDPLSFTWDFGDTKATPVYGAHVEHVYQQPGRYQATATADDGRNLACSKSKAIKSVVINYPPVATAPAEQFVDPGQKVTFDGSASYDPDGEVTEYQWDLGDGVIETGISAAYSYDKPGEYTITLTVKDDSNLPCNEHSDVTTIKVNAPPIADAGPDQQNICSLTVQFDGSNSRDPDGTIVAYEWDFGDGSPSQGEQKPTHTYVKSGLYQVTLTVIDDSGLSSGRATDTIEILINNPPVAIIQAPVISCPDEAIKFSAEGSIDPDGEITTYSWDFGDGSSGASTSVAGHTYQSPGQYTITLTVTDNSGSGCNTTTETQIILMNSVPIAAITGSDTVTCVNAANCAITLDASGSYDPDNHNLRYYWDFGDGSKAHGTYVQHEYTTPGTYTVTLTVKDDSGTSCTEGTHSMTVVVNAQPDARFDRIEPE